MNTNSLLLNGRTAADIALLPERQRASLTTLYHPRPNSSSSSPRQKPTSSRTTHTTTSTTPGTPTLSTPPTPTLSARTPPRRPTHKRSTPSRDSPGWYNTEGGMTLDDFARRLDSLLGRFEQYQGRCAQNVVMALLFSPTPVVLFLFNPVALVVWGLVGWWWVFA